MRRLEVWRHGCILALVTAAVLGITLVPAFANPDPPDWSAFKSATFFGVHLDPVLTSGHVDYSLYLDAVPTITIGSSTYALNWIGAYFVVAADQSKPFSASSGTITGPNGEATDWHWEVKPVHATLFEMAGWIAQGDGNRVKPGDPTTLKKLHYGSLAFDPQNSPVLSGLHVGYTMVVGQTEKTDFFKSDLGTTTPEPSSVVILLCGLAGLAARRRR